MSDYVRTELGASELSQAAEDAGHDGIMYGDEIIAFDPEQIKSVDNRGTFDPDDPRTFFQSTGLRAAPKTCRHGIEPGGRYKVRDVAIALRQGSAISMGGLIVMIILMRLPIGLRTGWLMRSSSNIKTTQKKAAWVGIRTSIKGRLITSRRSSQNSNAVKI